MLTKEHTLHVWQCEHNCVHTRTRYTLASQPEHSSAFKNMSKVISEVVVCCYGACCCKEKANGLST